jgi:hypothetical protein
MEIMTKKKKVVFLWYSILYLFGMVYSLHTVHVLLELILKTNHAVACVLSEVPGNLRAIFMKLVPVFLYATNTLSKVLTLQKLQNPPSFNMHLAINKSITALLL